jgi:hypothetical protein
MEEKSFELQASEYHVIGIAVNSTIRDRVLHALADGGFDCDEEVSVLHGEEGMKIVDPDGEYSGPFGKLLRAFQKFTTGVDERTLGAMKEALESDQYVFTVDADGSEKARDHIHAILRENGASNIFYNAPAYIQLLSGW